ncbi:MAG: NAD(P)-dependent alcohol dehydrogenase [Bacteroidota bacterium]
MKKAIFERYGDLDTIKLVDVESPTPAAGEVLIKVAYAGLNPKDILIRKGKFKRLSGKQFPQTVGFEFSGIVEESKVDSYQAGDKVFGMINGWKGRCCAELVRISANEIAPAPADLSHEQLSGIPLAGQTALQAIRDIGGLQPGQKICINGASGGVGTLAIQIAKALGGQVTTISSQKNTAFCQSLGADQTIAYDQEDVLKSQQRFDVFFDVFGNYSYQKTARLLTANGKYVTTVPKPEIFKEQFFNLFRKKKAKMIVVKSNTADIQWLAEHLATGSIIPVVDKVFSLNELKAAQAHIESKRAKGKVVISVQV